VIAVETLEPGDVFVWADRAVTVTEVIRTSNRHRLVIRCREANDRAHALGYDEGEMVDLVARVAELAELRQALVDVGVPGHFTGAVAEVMRRLDLVAEP
jgi:hypothetical protein